MIMVDGIVLTSYSLLTDFSVSRRTGKVTPSLPATEAALRDVVVEVDAHQHEAR